VRYNKKYISVAKSTFCNASFAFHIKR